MGASPAKDIDQQSRSTEKAWACEAERHHSEHRLYEGDFLKATRSK